MNTEDLTVLEEIDLSAVAGGLRIAGDSGSVEVGLWITDVLVDAAKTGGAYGVIAAAAKI